MTVKHSNPIDRHVGSRVRMRRLTMDMTQTHLADALGITFQQVQKYEKGSNRISASRLQHMCNILQVPVAFFFEGAPAGPAELVQPTPADAPYPLDEFIATREGLALAKAFMRIDKIEIRRRIVSLVEELDEERNIGAPRQ
jgi:transcriptional regulator with XRE-family HTH domain